MDRIGNPLLSQLGLTPAKPVGPRAIDPSPRLRLIDRQDRVEIAQPHRPASTSARPASSLVAGTVAAPASPTAPPEPASAGLASNAAIKLYTNPSDQNAAATRRAAAHAGSVLDVLA